MLGIIGKKIGMTQVFDADGIVTPVTVVEALPMQVTQVKTLETDGYEAIQVAAGEVKEKNVNKPLKGHFKKAGVAPKKYVKEFKAENVADYKLADEIGLSIFEEGEIVDVTGTSKGKGTAGVIKRHNLSRGPEKHGSKFHRGIGSLGAASTPSRIHKGMTMPGRMGRETTTVQNLKIVKVDTDRNLLLIKGAIPGPRKGRVIIKKAIKASK